MASDLCSKLPEELSQGLQCIPHLLNFVGLVVPGENTSSETRRLLRPAKSHGHNNDIPDENTATGALEEPKFYCYNNDINAQNIPVPHRYYCCGTGFGWLILIDDSLDMHLFNPLSGAKIKLPSGATAESSAWRLERFGKCFVDKAFLSCEPALSSLAQTHALIIYGGNMAFCKLGDEAWTIVVKYDGEQTGPGNTCRTYKDAVYYKDKFYVVYGAGRFVTFDVNSDPPELVVYEKLPPRTLFSGRSLYLLESKGELFQVRRDVVHDGQRGYESDDEICFVTDINQAEEGVDDNTEAYHGSECYRTTRCKVFKLVDGEGGGPEWENVESIGDRAFFVGQNGTFSISTSDFPDCSANSIYFTDDHQQAQYAVARCAEAVRHDIGVFQLEDKTIEHIYPIDAKPVMPYPFWYAPFHGRPN